MLLENLDPQGSEIRKKFPEFHAGDTISVDYKIREADRERVQQFQGTVLQIRHRNSNGETFTVRKISGNIAVERIFPLLTPNLEKITILRRGKVRRARIFYLRGKKGSAARIKEKRR